MNLSAFSQTVQYKIGHNDWDADSLGNHRAAVEVPMAGKLARVNIPWRRQDDAASRQVWVVDAATNTRIVNIETPVLDAEKATILFEPISGKGRYYIYYMPYKINRTSNYPTAAYYKRTPDRNDRKDPAIKPIQAKLLYLESIDSLNSFYPMEVTATKNEVQQLIRANPNSPYLVFPEDRTHVIKMQTHLPQRWTQQGAKKQFSGKAMKGEHYSYQLGIYPVTQDLTNVSLQFSDLKNAAGHFISASNISCLNTTGTRYNGEPFTQTINIKKETVQALWCLLSVPEKTVAGVYKGTVMVKADHLPETIISFTLQVENKIAVEHNIAHPELQTRLTWLNSTLAQANDMIKPYTALQVNDKTISLLGRKVMLNATGFPEQLQTFFTPEMTSLSDQPKNILAENIHFHIANSVTHKDITFTNKDFHYTTQEKGLVKWEASNSSVPLQMNVSGSLEFDGYMNYSVQLIALEDVSLDNIRFHIPFDSLSAKYLMGLGHKGGLRPDTVNWKWDVATKNQDGAWIGAVNAGLQYSLRDEKYVRPLNTNFYLQKPLLLPKSWGNDGKGGMWIGIKGKSMLMEAFTGARTLKKGDTLFYNFTLLITPFHTLDTDFQWATRFFHQYKQPDSIKATGATVVNIHHANKINPYINYPFIEYKAMKQYIDSAHKLGLKVKIYNTVRELSNRAYETFPMRSLGHEIYSTGKGGGYSWLQEHVVNDYIAAWFVPGLKDAAIVNSGMSRWHNYYVEGMNWLVQKVGIDGIYLDDVAFDRITMKRIKRVLTQGDHPGIVDLHSANQYNKSDGFNNSANLYMEHFPYLNRLWFGEYFDYEKSGPDFYLTEVSGIPFGLMGEMLQDGGNAWRGMLYGMTNRMPWSDNADPRPIWKVWDEFGMSGSRMIGYWVDGSPVKTDNASVLATVYQQPGRAMIALASWAEQDTVVRLKIDWKALGIDPSKAKLRAPGIKGFQEEKVFGVNEEIVVERGKGWLLIVDGV
ncbi:MAG: hypothetical protein EOP49_11285 [Sphingobacteriales bacterium]|nr:MAG: hypothetical protein EOP49_11285 [Sphingobacteriales bacterium]